MGLGSSYSTIFFETVGLGHVFYFGCFECAYGLMADVIRAASPAFPRKAALLSLIFRQWKLLVLLGRGSVGLFLSMLFVRGEFKHYQSYN